MTTPHEDTPGTSGWGPVPGSAQPVPPSGSGQPVPPPGYVTPPPGYVAPTPPPGYVAPPPPGYVKQPPPPGYGQQPGYGPQPGYGQQGPPPGYGAPAWRPPAFQPGIIPLRPLGVWEILDGSFRAIRANPRVMFGLAAIVVTIVVAVQAVVQWYVGGLLNGAVSDLLEAGNTSAELELGLGDQLGSSFASVMTAPFTALATTLLTGLLIVSVSRSVIGEKISIGDVSKVARVRIWWVLGFTLLLGLATAVVFGVVIGGIVLLARAESWGLLAVVAIVGGLGLVALTVWITVRTLLVPAALMLEGASFWTSVRRAWVLTRGSFWRLFGIYLLVQIIVGIVASIIVYPASILSMLIFRDEALTSFGSILVLSVGDAIALTLTTVYSAAVIALLYIDVRMRREGLDVELARAADAKAA